MALCGRFPSQGLVDTWKSSEVGPESKRPRLFEVSIPSFQEHNGTSSSIRQCPTRN